MSPGGQHKALPARTAGKSLRPSSGDTARFPPFCRTALLLGLPSHREIGGLATEQRRPGNDGTCRLEGGQKFGKTAKKVGFGEDFGVCGPSSGPSHFERAPGKWVM